LMEITKVSAGGFISHSGAPCMDIYAITAERTAPVQAARAANRYRRATVFR